MTHLPQRGCQNPKASSQSLVCTSWSLDTQRCIVFNHICTVCTRTHTHTHSRAASTAKCCSTTRKNILRCEKQREKKRRSLTPKGWQRDRRVIARLILLIVCIYWRAVNTTKLGPKIPGVGGDFFLGDKHKRMNVMRWLHAGQMLHNPATVWPPCTQYKYNYA